jgi:putative peptide zinc metalloprotease protein
VLLLPRLLASAWTSGRSIAGGLGHQLGSGDVLGVLAGVLELIALFLPVLGSALITQRLVRTALAKARAWSAGRPGRRAVAVIAGVAVLAGLAWAWWPSGQYQPVRASERGTLPSFVQMLGSPQTVVRSSASPAGAPVLAMAAIPRGGATAAHPALFLLPARDGSSPSAVVVGGAGQTGASFPFLLPAKPGPGDTQALAVDTQDGGVVYDISYALVTVRHGAPVTSTNGAFAFAHCRGCTTVAVSFQVVLVVGQSEVIAPINAAGALNVDCPACMTTAIADQIVVTVSKQPSAELRAKLEAALARLDALPALGADATPAEIAAQVAAVQQAVETTLSSSGIVTGAPAGGTATTSPGPASTDSASPTASTAGAATTTSSSPTTAATTGSAAPTSSSAPSSSSAPASSTDSPAASSTSGP